MVCFHLAPKLLLAWVHRQRRQQQARTSGGLPAAAAAAAAGDGLPAAKQPLDSCCTSDASGSGGSPRGPDPCPASAAEAGQGGGAAAASQPRLAPAPTSVRPPVPLLRGLSSRMDRWKHERPAARRRLALAAITVSFMGCCSLQILAPGFVDVSIGEWKRQMQWSEVE